MILEKRSKSHITSFDVNGLNLKGALTRTGKMSYEAVKIPHTFSMDNLGNQTCLHEKVVQLAITIIMDPKNGIHKTMCIKVSLAS